MSEYNEGDLVEAVKGDCTIRGRLVPSQVGLRLEDAGWSIAGFEMDRWAVTVIEKAAPKLPDEPGVYIESGKPVSHASIWTLAPNGKWLCAANAKYDGRAAEFAPFTRLEPVPVTAKKVLDEVRGHGTFWAGAKTLDDIAKQFGVTS